MKPRDEKVVKIKYDEKNIHRGHRKRLMDLVQRVGLENLTQIQIVEVFLCYIFPRGDVNPLAHRLLKRFSTFSDIVNAEVEELKQVEGINDRAAILISNFQPMFQHYISCRKGSVRYLKTKTDIANLVEDYLRFRTTEHMLLVALSPSNHIISKRIFCMNETNKVQINVVDLTTFLTSTKPSHIVVAHCHPFGFAKPSSTDDFGFRTIENVCRNFGVELYDSYIIGEDGIFSMREEIMLRQYLDVAELHDLLKLQ